MTGRPVPVAPLREGDLDAELRRVRLREATVEAAVNEVRRQWSKALNGRPVPAILIVEQESGSDAAYRQTMTCDLARVPVRVFLGYVPAMLAGYQVEIGAEAIVLRGPPPYIVEDGAQSGKGELLTPPPHTTVQAGPHTAVH